MSVWGDVANLVRLVNMGRVLARHDALMELDALGEPPLVMRAARKVLRVFSPGAKAQNEDEGPLAAALTELGPSHIKFGQFLATRRDIVGEQIAEELSHLQDKLPPFDQALALEEIDEGLGEPHEKLFKTIGPAIAAASIAQVHKAQVEDENGLRNIAVKVLRPGIEERFRRDISVYYTAARLIERIYAPARRLRPIAVVETMAHSVELEMDLRLEAAAISEMAENTSRDDDFSVPEVDWSRTSRRVLTTEWIDAIPLNRIDLIREAGIDLQKLADTIIRSFLRHAMRDGFFHADMHQGNLFADKDGRVIAVDLGIMGRLSLKDRHFLAEILYGFIHGEYMRISKVHFDAGYVPKHQSIETFAQALRAIGEPLLGKQAEDISMASLLGQLLSVTEQFDMETQPQLILLQKTMVVVEGVARNLNPDLNMWNSAAPVVEEWMRAHLGPEGILREAKNSAAAFGNALIHMPDILDDAREGMQLLAQMGRSGGIHLDQASVEALGKSRQSTSNSFSFWLGLAIVLLTGTWLLY